MGFKETLKVNCQFHLLKITVKENFFEIDILGVYLYLTLILKSPPLHCGHVNI